MVETSVEKWQSVIKFTGKQIPEEKTLVSCTELEYIGKRYLNSDFKTDSPFCINDMYSAETELFHKEIKNSIIKFSNEKEKNRI